MESGVGGGGEYGEGIDGVLVELLLLPDLPCTTGRRPQDSEPRQRRDQRDPPWHSERAPPAAGSVAARLDARQHPASTGRRLGPSLSAHAHHQIARVTLEILTAGHVALTEMGVTGILHRLQGPPPKLRPP